jgi:hypothetical protein
MRSSNTCNFSPNSRSLLEEVPPPVQSSISQDFPFLTSSYSLPSVSLPCPHRLGHASISPPLPVPVLLLPYPPIAPPLSCSRPSPKRKRHTADPAQNLRGGSSTRKARSRLSSTRLRNAGSARY